MADAMASADDGGAADVGGTVDGSPFFVPLVILGTSLKLQI